MFIPWQMVGICIYEFTLLDADFFCTVCGWFRIRKSIKCLNLRCYFKQSIKWVTGWWWKRARIAVITNNVRYKHILTKSQIRSAETVLKLCAFSLPDNEFWLRACLVSQARYCKSDAELSNGCRVSLTGNYSLTVTYSAGRALTFFKSSLSPHPIFPFFRSFLFLQSI